MDVRNPEVLRWAVTLWVYAHWLPDITTRKGVDRLDDGLRPQPARNHKPYRRRRKISSVLGGKC